MQVVDSRNAELAVAIATGVAVSPQLLSPPEGTPANKLRRRLLIEGNSEARSLSYPGARVASAVFDAGGAASAAKPEVVLQRPRKEQQ